MYCTKDGNYLIGRIQREIELDTYLKHFGWGVEFLK